MKRKEKKQQFLHLLIAALLLLALILVFSRSTRLSEAYMQHFYPLYATLFSFLSGIVPFSLYDLLTTIALLWGVGMTSMLLFRKIGWNRFLLSVGWFVLIGVAWFYLGWGMAYFRSDFYARSELEKALYDSEKLMRLTETIIEQANHSYLDCSGM